MDKTAEKQAQIDRRREEMTTIRTYGTSLWENGVHQDRKTGLG
jgi:hypothetical protein